MKKILKITFVTVLAFATILMTLVTSFAGNVSPDYVDVYSPTYNLREFNFLASPSLDVTDSYYVNLSNLSLYAKDETTSTREPTNITIPPQANDPTPTFYISTYTTLDSPSSRLFTGVQVKDRNFQLPYYTIRPSISMHFGEMVLNPELTSGAVNFWELLLPDTEIEYYSISLIYSGECYFPLLDGGFRVVPFHISGVFTDFEDEPLDGNNFRFSLAPSIMTDNNSFNKMTAQSFYANVYRYLNETERDGLIDPYEDTFFKEGDPIALRSYSVDADLRLRTADGFVTPTCKGINLEFPASINGVVRPDEDFLRAWNTYNDRPIDFEEFSFVSWIETIVFGLGTIEFIPESGFYLLYPVIGSVALALLIWALKVFLGG